MIAISSCPITGLKRKLDYNFLIYKSIKQIIIECNISHYDINNVHINNARINDYGRPLVASNDKVNATTGELDPSGTITQFDYYNQLGTMPVAIYSEIEKIILKRDLEGKFNI